MKRLRWDRVPLRVKLISAVLVLVALALVVIGVASAVALRSYLVDRVDGQLKASAAAFASRPLPRLCNNAVIEMPSDYLVVVTDSQCQTIFYDRSAYGSGDIPTQPKDLDEIRQRVSDQPFTELAADGHRRWRVLVTELSSGQVLAIGEDMSGVDSAMDRLILIDLLVGVAVLLLLALAGVWLVRVSLRPLVAMERTAAAIAGGDLTRRVPDLDPRTELGRLSNALNTMLAQIEAAFLAREASERSARAAEAAARDAADAATASQARAVRSEERMRQFVADASHELRTPLTTIRGFAELFRQGAAADPGAVLGRIEDEASRMGLLVEDLLLLARLDRERPLRMAPVVLAELLTDAASAARVMDPVRGITVNITPPAARWIVEGDETRLRQVIANLVTNAIIHTPTGTPVTLTLRPNGEHRVVIEVSDLGPGLTAEQAEHVFERFYRVDKSRSRRAAVGQGEANHHSGSGLGLAIVAALVAAHGGTVEVDSEPGRGATFRVHLPLVETIEPDEPIESD